MGVNTSVPVGVSLTSTGTTTNDYAIALKWPCVGLGSKQIWLKNTHGVNGLTYKVTTYLDGGGISSAFLGDTALVAGATDDILLTRPYGLVVVEVKSTVAASHATYQIDIAGGRP